METLADVCLSGERGGEKEQLRGVVARMLDLDSSQRIDIETVKLELDKLPRGCKAQNGSGLGLAEAEREPAGP